ncbi:hypothetical protein WA026_000975 [Henosepilachna vigintioctopunctata]
MEQFNTLEDTRHNPYIYSDESTSLLSKYDLPITHLDFSYVEKCKNGKELEQILHVLKSGQEGYFPELIEAVENKLRILLPKSRWLRNLSKVIEPQDIAKEEWTEIVNDLNNWVGNISIDNKELENRKGDSNISVGNIRKAKSITEEQNSKKVRRIKSTDYASWDKYDPDTEILKLDLQEEKNKKQTVRPGSKRRTEKEIKFNNFATEAEATFEANRQKEKGNECFKAGEYSSAIIHYTYSLECKKTVKCFNNRSMAYIKQGQYDKAIDDCDSALDLDPNNLKSNFRKSVALEQVGRLEEALESSEECLKVDPNNKAAQEIVERLRKMCGVTLTKKRFKIEDVQWVTDRRKEISKDTKRYERFAKTKNSLSRTQNEVLIPIPGTSNMKQPYFVVCDEKDVPNVLCQIQNRPQTLGVLVVPQEEEEDCTINHLNHICSKNERENEFKCENVLKRDNAISQFEHSKKFNPIPKCSESNLKKETPARIKLKKAVKTPSESEQKVQVDDKDAGGEPYNKSDILTLPEDIHYPYTFLKIWLSVSHDSTLKKHAHIIKNLNMDQLVRVIGCKLDNGIFTTLLKTLSMHFTVPGEVEKVYAVLVNVASLPRFEIISLLMSEQDRSYVSILINFLHQHDKDLPDDVKERFQFIRKKT